MLFAIIFMSLVFIYMSGVNKSIRHRHNKTAVKNEYEEEYRNYKEYNRQILEEIDIFHYNRLPIFE
jgi:hypothetical protein